MNLLEKVRLLKKKEKPEEEPPAEEHKPRENRGHQDEGREGQEFCAWGASVSKTGHKREIAREPQVGRNERGGEHLKVRPKSGGCSMCITCAAMSLARAKTCIRPGTVTAPGPLWLLYVRVFCFYFL
jgi:hypothetical protein